MSGDLKGRKKAKKERRGRFKLVVFFKDHHLRRGFTMHSKVGQDVRGVSLEQFKGLVLRGKFAGRVKWAGIYELGTEVWRYSDALMI